MGFYGQSLNCVTVNKPVYYSVSLAEPSPKNISLLDQIL